MTASLSKQWCRLYSLFFSENGNLNLLMPHKYIILDQESLMVSIGLESIQGSPMVKWCRPLISYPPPRIYHHPETTWSEDLNPLHFDSHFEKLQGEERNVEVQVQHINYTISMVKIYQSAYCFRLALSMIDPITQRAWFTKHFRRGVHGLGQVISSRKSDTGPYLAQAWHGP